MNSLSKAGAVVAGVVGTISVIGTVVAGVIIILYTRGMNGKENDRDLI